MILKVLLLQFLLLGKIGGVGFTPIINPPQVGIVGVSKSQKKLYLENKKIIEKDILPISLSYDHRVINGADAGRGNPLNTQLRQRK